MVVGLVLRLVVVVDTPGQDERWSGRKGVSHLVIRFKVLVSKKKRVKIRNVGTLVSCT